MVVAQPSWSMESLQHRNTNGCHALCPSTQINLVSPKLEGRLLLPWHREALSLFVLFVSPNIYVFSFAFNFCYAAGDGCGLHLLGVIWNTLVSFGIIIKILVGRKRQWKKLRAIISCLPIQWILQSVSFFSYSFFFEVIKVSYLSGGPVNQFILAAIR